MFTDPLSVTYNGSAKSLARISSDQTGSVYATADGEFLATVKNSPTEDGLVRIEVLFGRNTPDPTPDPFSGGPGSVPNRVGLVYEVNPNRFYSTSEIPLLRTALLSLVDSTFQSRLIAGEK